MIRWVLVLVVLLCFFNTYAISVSSEYAIKNKEDKDTLFIKQLREIAYSKNLDSLERVFANFTQNTLNENRLAQGQSLLNEIIADKSLSDTLKILAFKNKAVLYGQIDLNKKRDAFNGAIQLIQTKNCLPNLLPVYQLEVAKTHLSQSRFLDATEALNSIHFDAVKDPEKQVEIMGISGLLYLQMDDTLKALQQLNDALRIAQKHTDYFGLGTIHSSIGNLKIKFSQHYGDAIFHFRSSMQAFQKAGYAHYALGSQADIGASFARMFELDSARYYLEKSYNEALEMGAIYDQAICAKELGSLYNKLGKPQDALRYCLEAKLLNWEYASYTFRNTCALCLANAYEAMDKYDSSLFYFKVYHAYLDSTLSKSETKAIAKFNAELEKQLFVAEQEKINLKTAQQLKTRNLYILFLSILSVLILGIFILLLRGAKNRKKRELIEQQEKNQREFSKGLLQSLEDERKRVSMELHDSVGQILVVAGRNVSNKQFEQVEPMLHNALSEVRTISQGLHPYILEKMGLEDAILNLIHTADSNHDLFIESEVDLAQSELSKDQEIHVYRIVQELLSNCIKHAQSPSLGIEIHSDEKEIRIYISDKGRGFDVNDLQSKKSMSLGMKTLHERVVLLNGTIHFESKPNLGTTVTVIIPSKP